MKKLRQLAPEKVAEVEGFVDVLHRRQEESHLVRALAGASEGSVAKLWDNPDESECCWAREGR